MYSNETGTNPYQTGYFDMTGNTGTNNMPVKDTWIYCKKTIVLNSDCQLGIYVGCGSEGPSPEGSVLKTTVLIKDLKVEEGNKATTWSPAPEDVDQNISNAQTAAQKYATDKCVTIDGNNAPSSIKNSTVSIGSDGTLNNAGGGKVTIRGLGYTGDLDATKGATWGTDLHNIPDELGKPSAPGLYLTGTSMGYWDGSAFKTYMDNKGNMVLGDPATAKGLSWNQSTGDLSSAEI